jgi:hypothetical protein
MTNATTLERVKQYTEVALKAAGIKAKVEVHDEDADCHYIMIDDVLQIDPCTEKKPGLGGIYREVPAWVLTEWVHTPGTHWDPPESYDREVMSSTIPAEVAKATALHFVKDRIEGALQAEGEREIIQDNADLADAMIGD